MLKKYKKSDDISYTLGTTLTFELLHFKPEMCTTVYVHPNLNKDETYNKLIDLCNKHNINVIENTKVFNIVSDKENCYCIGVFKKYNMTLSDNNHLVLVNPSDMGNLGTIIRSCLGFSIKNIAIIAPGCDAFNPKVVRGSMGAIFKVNIEYFDSFEAYYNKFNHHKMYPLMLKAKTSLGNLDVNKEEKFSIIFGNEATGLPDSFLNIGTPVIINHSKDIDSLNLGIACSITLYEFTKKYFN